MSIKNIFSKLLQPVGMIVASSLLVGMAISSPLDASAVSTPEPTPLPTSEASPKTSPEESLVETSEQEPTPTPTPTNSPIAPDQSATTTPAPAPVPEYTFSIYTNSDTFYTENEEPRIFVDRGNVPEKQPGADKLMGGPYYFHWIDLTTQTTFYVTNGSDVGWKIPRFYFEDSRDYKVVLAKSNSIGAVRKPVSEIGETIAESNVITISRGKWEISTQSTFVDHDGAATIASNVNQSLWEKMYFGLNNVDDPYSIYTENLNTGEIKKSSKGAQGTKAGSATFSIPGEFEIGRFKAYVAKDATGITSSSQLEHIQAVSNEIVVTPRKWGVRIVEAVVKSESPKSGTKVVEIVPQATRSLNTTLRAYYVENVTTGKIIAVRNPAVRQGRWSFSFTAPLSSNEYIIHLANAGQTVEYPSQLQGLRASSNQAYPENLSPGYGENPGRSGMLQNGGNPSTADCEQQCYGDPINALNGELFENDVDLQVEGAMALNFVRSSSSFRSDAGAFGTGTTFSYNMKIRGDKSSLDSSEVVTISQENGSTVSFAAYDGESGSKSFVAPSSVRASLSVGSDGNYTFTRLKTQDRFIFDSSGKLLKIQDRLGNEVTLSYTGEKLTAVSNGSSTIDIDWTGSLITEISSGPRSVAYSYDQGRLITVDSSQIANDKSYSYYPDGSLKTITHPNGGSYETTYDSTGRAVSQTNPLGGITSFEYQTGGYTLITLPGGEKTREKYNNLGQLVERTLAYGTAEAKVYSYSYQGTGEKILDTLPGGKKITYRYDARGNLNYLANPANEVYRFSYNSENQLIKTTDPLNRISTNEYDQSGKLLKSVNYDGTVTTYEHNSKGMLTAVKDPLDQVSGLESSYSYSNSDLLDSTTDTEGNVTSYSYNAARNPVKITDALNNETAFSYSRHNPALVSKIVYANGAEETASYDGAGRKVSSTLIDGTTVEYSYDAMDNLLSETTPHGTTSYEYDSNQKLTAVVNPKGARIEYEYNALGLVVKEKLPGGREKLKEYGVDGLISAEVDPKGNRTAYAYDAAGRPIKVTDALGKITTMSYDKLGNLLKKTYPSGNWVSYSYDKLNRVTTINEKDLRKTTYSYDVNGNRTKESLSDGTFETRSYNSEDRLIEVVGRDGKSTGYNYDVLGRVAEETRVDGSKIEFSYDSVGNLISSDYGSGHIYENSYNLKGQLLESKTPEGITTEYGYNPSGDLISRGPPQTKVGYSYNSYGEIESISYPSGLSVGYAYDPVGNLESVTSGGETLASYSYDNSYNLTASNYGNGVAESAQFDALNRLSGITLASSGADVYSRSLQFNVDSQISNAVTTHSGAIKQKKTYQYSPLNTVSSAKNELTVKTENSTYDLVNNAKTIGASSYLYTGNTGQIALASTPASGFKDYTYDERGNRTSASEMLLSPYDRWEFSWTKSDRLESVFLPFSYQNVDYTYDADGLINSRVKGWFETPEQFSWDTVSGSVPTLLEDGGFEYVYGSESTPFLQINKSTGERIYLHGDERNSIVSATDAAGAVLWHRDYNEYGSIFTRTSVGAAAGASETRFAYAGEYLDPDTKLYNLRARWYDPQTASFLSVDPAVHITGEKYSYASGNPLSNTDPLGLWSMNDTSTSIAAAVDGFIGFPLAADFMNSINPGSVDNCSALYIGVGTVAMVGSLFVPGMGPIKAAAAVGKVAVGASKATSKVWKVGDSITQKTARGNDPTWNTIRSRYWKNEAQSAQNVKGLTPEQLKRKGLPGIEKDWTKKWEADDIARMAKGKAPQRQHPDNLSRKESMELSHESVPQRNASSVQDLGNVIQRWPQEHAAVDDYRKLSPNYPY